MPLNQAIELIGSIAVNLGLKISLFFLVIAFADFAYQKYKFNKDIKMTKLKQQTVMKMLFYLLKMNIKMQKVIRRSKVRSGRR